MSAFRGPAPAPYGPGHRGAPAALHWGAQGGQLAVPSRAGYRPAGYQPAGGVLPPQPQGYAYDGLQAYPPTAGGPVDELLRVLVRSLEALGASVLKGTGAACSALNCSEAAAALGLELGEEGPAPSHAYGPYGQRPYPPSPEQYAAYPPSPMPYAYAPSPVPGRAAYQAWPQYSPEARDGGRYRRDRSDVNCSECCGALVEWPDVPWESCNPDLRVPHHSPPLFEFSCADVVSSTEGDEWVGRWHLTKEERLELLSIIDTGGKDGQLSLTELKSMGDNRAFQAAMEYMPGSAKGLLNPRYVEEVFARFDADQSGTIDANEWNAFLDTLANMHQEYLCKKAQVAFRAYWGRGAVWGLRPGQESLLLPWEALLCASLDCTPEEYRQGHQRPLPAHRCFQVGRDPDGRGSVCPPGWWADLYYYSANNHPLHGIFAADPLHPLSRLERLMLEVAGFGFLFYVLHMEHLYELSPEDKERMVSSGKLTIVASLCTSSLVTVTLPSMAVWWVLFLLFTCPCAIVDESRTTQTCCATLTSRFAALTGYVLVATGLVYLLNRFLMGHVNFDDVLVIAWGRLRGYLFSWALEVFVYFNPLLAWGQTDPSKSGSCGGRLCGWLGDCVGLGQWRIEKQLFQARCASQVRRWQELHEEKAEKAARAAPGLSTLGSGSRATAPSATAQSAEHLQTRLSAVADARRAPEATLSPLGSLP